MRKIEEKQEFINETINMHVALCFSGLKKPRVSDVGGSHRTADAILNCIRKPKMAVYDKSERLEVNIALNLFGYTPVQKIYSIDTDRGEFVFVNN